MSFHWMGKSADGNTVTLKRLQLDFFNFPKTCEAENIRTGAVLDVETTGLSSERDKIIEIGIRQFKFNRITGEFLSLEKSYSAFQDPGVALDPEIINLTGITDEMLEGQKIDWNTVNEILKESHVIVAHNASFDRPFVDRVSEVSRNKIWSCSLKQMNWKEKGYTSAKLDLLCIYHGFFTDAHRALNDADALLYLLSLNNQAKQTPYFLELITNAKKVSVHVIASQSPFESKDHLKFRNYRWDGQNKYWSKHIAKDLLPSEIQWLEESVYSGPFRGKTVEILPEDQFKG